MTRLAESTPFPRAPIGTTREGDPFTIALDDIAAYVDATNDRLARYESFGVAPPIYAVVSSASSHVGLLLDLVPGDTLLSSVHLGHIMDFHRPARIGETVTSRAELVETRRTPFGFALTMRVDVWSETGDLSSTCYHRVLFRGLREGQTAGESPTSARTPRQGAAPLLGERHFDVAFDQSIRYASASRDLLPIHTHRDVARRAGFPDLILHGMCTLAMCGQTVVDVVADGDPTRLRSIGATFVRPVVVGRGLAVAVAGSPNDVLRVAVAQDGQPVVRDAYAKVSAE